MSRTAYCSFCGKRDDEVKHLVHKAKVFICDECVIDAQRIIDRALGKEPAPLTDEQEARVREIVTAMTGAC